MEYNSFYGGRQGASFVIQEKYLTITEMVKYFQMGNGYKTVNYDEYVIIDTENKNDPDNGKVYRRGYDYTNSMGGALYVGQIVGPAGLAPHTEIKTIEEVKNIQETEGFEYRRGEGEYSVTNASLVAGKDSDGNFNDTIEWVYCSVRDANSSDSTAHIGFKVPYTVIDFTASIASPYTEQAEELAIRIDDTTHPFYEKWQLKIPKGIKGDAIENLREDTDENGNRILVYDSINYESSSEGVKTTHEIGLLNDIESIAISADGKIVIEYSAAADVDFQLKYPSSIILDESTQRLLVTYTDGNTELIGDPINYILETAIPTEYRNDYRYHLLVRYSAKKPTSSDPKITHKGYSDWFDLGAVKSDSGILIGGDLGDSTVLTPEECIIALNTALPDGHEEGKIMTAGEPPLMDKGFFAFDYTLKTWYYLGSLGSTVVSVLAAEENSAEAAGVPPGGIWFVVETKE